MKPRFPNILVTVFLLLGLLLLLSPGKAISYYKA
jgi:hypothetical protein